MAIIRQSENNKIQESNPKKIAILDFFATFFPIFASSTTTLFFYFN